MQPRLASQPFRPRRFNDVRRRERLCNARTHVLADRLFLVIREDVATRQTACGQPQFTRFWIRLHHPSAPWGVSSTASHTGRQSNLRISHSIKGCTAAAPPPSSQASPAHLRLPIHGQSRGIIRNADLFLRLATNTLVFILVFFFAECVSHWVPRTRSFHCVARDAKQSTTRLCNALIVGSGFCF